MNIQLTQNKVAIIDDSDALLVAGFKWRYVRNHNCEYANAWHPLTGELVVMHRLLLGISDRSIKVDHRDGSGLNNRRANLRVATHSQNLQNSRKHCASSSRFKGVWLDKRTGKWVAQIVVNKKKICRWGYSSEDEAAKEYDQMAVAHFGEFARLNFGANLSSVS